MSYAPGSCRSPDLVPAQMLGSLRVVCCDRSSRMNLVGCPFAWFSDVGIWSWRLVRQLSPVHLHNPSTIAPTMKAPHHFSFSSWLRDHTTRSPHLFVIWNYLRDHITPSSRKNISRVECCLLFVWRPARRKTRVATRTKGSQFSAETIISCCSWLSVWN